MVRVPKHVSKCSVCGNKHPYYEGGCPLKDIYRRGKNMDDIPKEMFGDSPSIFVGRVGYPRVNAGPMATMEEGEAEILRNPSEWFGMDYEDVIELQTFLIRSKTRTDVESSDRFVRDNQLLAMSEGSADVELSFRKKPSVNLQFDRVASPVAISGSLDDMRITENIKVPRGVEKIVDDELKAEDQAARIYDKGMDVYKVQTILSSGALGLDEGRKIVPTRWAVTATQTMVADDILGRVKDYSSVNDFIVYSSEYLDNHFEVLLIPGSWEFENFEAWAPVTGWGADMKRSHVIQEHEPYEGRSDYAESQGGGYYASRLGVAEGLDNIGRQARAVVFREVSEGYVFPVGSWQILENIRNAFSQDPRRFDTRKEVLSHIDDRLHLSITDYIKQSSVLGQRRLSQFSLGN